MPRILRSAVIAAPIADVWAVLRDFNSHHLWHPAIAESVIEGFLAPDTVGCVRAFSLREGGQLRERLLDLSDRDHSLRYAIISGTLPLRDYVATIRLRPVTGRAHTFLQWESRFAAPDDAVAAMQALVAHGVYDAGFVGLAAYLRGHHATPAAMATGEPQAVVMERHGGPDVLRLRRWPVPPPGPGDVRLRHIAIGVNFIDVYARSGRFKLVSPPGVPGMEAAGIVLEAGAGVALRPGQRVAYACAPTGAYAQERTMPAALVLPLPDDIDEATAAATLLKGMTAAFLLHDVHPIEAGARVLVHAAAGGTGSLLVQWAAALGAHVIGVVGDAAKRAEAVAHGCAEVLVGGDDLAARLREARVAVAFDGVGAKSFPASYAALGERGHLVSFGQASGDLPPVDISGFAEKSARVSRPNFGHYTGTRPQAERLAGLLFAALRRGVLRPAPPRRFALADAEAAHRALESRQTTGALLLIP